MHQEVERLFIVIGKPKEIAFFSIVLFMVTYHFFDKVSVVILKSLKQTLFKCSF